MIEIGKDDDIKLYEHVCFVGAELVYDIITKSKIGSTIVTSSNVHRLWKSPGLATSGLVRARRK